MKRAVLAHAPQGARARAAAAGALDWAAAAIALEAAPDLDAPSWRGFGGGRFEVEGGEPRLRAPRVDDPVLYRATSAAGEWIASDLRALVAARAVAPTLDRAALAGLLWRGAPLGARPLLRGVEPVRAAGEPAAEPRASLDDAATALRAAVDRSGATVALFYGDRASITLARALKDVHPDGAAVVYPRRAGADAAHVDAAIRAAKALGLDLVVADAEPPGALDDALESWRAAVEDVPSVDAFATFAALSAVAKGAGRATIASPLGGPEAFGDAAWSSPPRRLAAIRTRIPFGLRVRAGGDPMDVAHQRDRERVALSRAPAARVGSAASLLPSATRAAIAPALLRTSDGVVPATEGRARLADIAVLGACRDAGLADLDSASRALGVGITCPYLDEAFRARVRALPDDVRFGREGSGGALATWAGAGTPSRSSIGAPVGIAADGRAIERATDAWLRGPLAGVVERDLAPDRVRAAGLFDPEAVATAVARWRAKERGWEARPVLLLALVVDWVRRHGLSIADDGP